MYLLKTKHKPYKNESWNKKEAKELFQILPFKHLANIELLHELPFYDELSVVEISKASKRYARSNKIEIIDSKDPLAQLEASISGTEDLFKDLFNEMNGFNYQITITVLLCKHKINGDIEYAPVYFNSATKTIINSDKYGLDKSFQEILCTIDNWINEGSAWIIESVEAQYVNISIYSPLIGRNTLNYLIN